MVTYTGEAILYGNLHSRGNTLWQLTQARRYSMVTYTAEAIRYGNLQARQYDLHSCGNTLW